MLKNDLLEELEESRNVQVMGNSTLSHQQDGSELQSLIVIELAFMHVVVDKYYQIMGFVHLNCLGLLFVNLQKVFEC